MYIPHIFDVISQTSMGYLGNQPVNSLVTTNSAHSKLY